MIRARILFRLISLRMKPRFGCFKSLRMPRILSWIRRRARRKLVPSQSILLLPNRQLKVLSLSQSSHRKCRPTLPLLLRLKASFLGEENWIKHLKDW